MKKKFLSIPAILLLLLLFVFHGITYADTYRTWTKSDIQNVIYNYGIAKQQSSTNMETYITNLDTVINELLEDINSYQNVIFLCQTDGSFSNFAFLLQDNTTSKWYYSRSRIYSTNTSNCKYYLYTPAGTCSTGTRWLDNFFNDNIFYTSNIIYTNYNVNTIKYNAGYYNPNTLFSGPYEEETTPILLFNQAESSTNIDVDIFEDIPAYTNSPNNNMYLGYLLVPKTNRITNFQLTRAYYNNNMWNYRLVTNKYQNEYIYYDKYYENDELALYDVYMNNTLVQENNIYIITWWDQTKEPYETVTGTFYIKNGNTNIVNGEVIPSGDTTNAILQNQEENDSFWKEAYNNLFTIDSGDAEEIINNFLESSNLGEYGLESGEIAILNVLNGEPSDFIISWNSVIIPNLKDNTPTQLVPAGNINFSKISVTLGNESYTLTEERLNQFMIIIGWVQLIMGISVVILTIANVWETLMRALGVGVGLYEDNADEHSTIVNVGEDGKMSTTEVVRTPTKSRVWYIHKKY